MQACGVIVEYNPFHNGHDYHLHKAKQTAGADCIIAVMSGNFLQRGEPAIVDKFSRAKMAIDQGADIVIELPYSSTVQHSDLFAEGAITLLNELQVSSVCFGSELGTITPFLHTYHSYKNNETLFYQTLKEQLSLGVSYPKASEYAYQYINIDFNETLDLTKPNNILGFSYIKAIKSINPIIQPFTIKRKQSDYHDKHLTTPYASATSIRHQLLNEAIISQQIQETMPERTADRLKNYHETAGTWHHWEDYFSLLQYRVLTMDTQGLAAIHGVDEGLENRLIKTAKNATSFQNWMDNLKSKRYTQTRLQRMFTHLLTNTSKKTMNQLQQQPFPYIRLLGLSEQGRAYLNHTKKERTVPIFTQFSKPDSLMMEVEERVSNAYYAILAPHIRKNMRKQEFEPPYRG